MELQVSLFVFIVLLLVLHFHWRIIDAGKSSLRLLEEMTYYWQTGLMPAGRRFSPIIHEAYYKFFAVASIYSPLIYFLIKRSWENYGPRRTLSLIYSLKESEQAFSDD